MRKPDEQTEGVVRHNLLEFFSNSRITGVMVIWKSQVQRGSPGFEGLSTH